MPFGLLGGYARKYHGPDSPYAVFEADSCSAPLGLPSCAQWVPDDKFVLFKYLWERVPRVSEAGTVEPGWQFAHELLLPGLSLVLCLRLW